MKARIFFRCDASGSIGAGHFMRCLALAQACPAESVETTFLTACRADGLLERARRAGAKIVEISDAHPSPADLQQTGKIIKESCNPWVVLDGYNFDADFASAIMQAGCRLLRLDDLADQNFYPCDLLLNQNIYAADLEYKTPPAAKLLLGTRYALLRREFMEFAGRQKTINPSVSKILITLGGSDPQNMTATAIESVAGLNLGDLEIKAVVGPACPHLDAIRRSAEGKKCKAEILTNVEDMPGLMAWADLAISAAGSTCWELAFMGTPAILAVAAENQARNAAGSTKAGFALAIPQNCPNLKIAIRDAVQNLSADQARRRKMSAAGRQTVDGQGAARVAGEMIERANSRT